MTTTDQDKRRDEMRAKVEKLFAQAEHPNTGKDEAETFYAKAQEMMTKFSITEAELRSAEDSNWDAVTETVLLDGVYSKAQLAILNEIALPNDCYVIYVRGGGSLLFANVVGASFDVATVLDFFERLKDYAMAKSREDYRAHKRENPDTESFYFRRAFLLAFAARVGARVTQAAKQAHTEVSTGTEIVLVSKRDAVESYVREEFPATTKSRMRPRRGSAAGSAAGRKAGSIGDAKVPSTAAGLR